LLTVSSPRRATSFPLQGFLSTTQLKSNSIARKHSLGQNRVSVYSFPTVTGFGYINISLASHLHVVLQVQKDAVISTELASLTGLSTLAIIRTKTRKNV
jgi:hypothetical protein